MREELLLPAKARDPTESQTQQLNNGVVTCSVVTIISFRAVKIKQTCRTNSMYGSHWLCRAFDL